MSREIIEENISTFEPKISIVVAIYKVEKYLKHCIESILSSTYKNIEVILVDDGSPDACPTICDEFVRQDNRIQVIHQNNQGLVNARRNGVKKATGEYVSMIDGDDWVSSDYYKMMVDSIGKEDIDLLVCGYTEVVNGKNYRKGNSLVSGVYEKSNLEKVKLNALSNGSFYTPGIVPAVWCKLFRRELLVRVQVNVPECVRMGEDAAITYSFIAASNRIVINNDVNGYFYRILNNSMSHSVDELYFERVSSLVNFLEYSLVEYKTNIIDANFVYYKLFLFQIGVEQLISICRQVGVVQTKKRINKGKMLLDIKKSWEIADKKNMNTRKSKELEIVIHRGVFMYMFYCFIRKYFR